MKFRNLITAAAISLLPVLTQAATFVVPAVGTGPGANDSQWQSEVTLHTAGPRLVTLSMELHQGRSVLGPVEVTLQPRQTLSIADIARTRFGLTAGTGALVINLSDRDAKTLAITSRTFNTSPRGEFGQDIPAYNALAANRDGDIAVIPGPAQGANRFNAGAYALEASTVKFDVLRADGTVAASREVVFAGGEHAQFNGAIEFIGAEKRDNDTVHARLLTGKAIFYGSIVNSTDDPTFVPAMRTRDDILITFAGIDLDENGTVDVADANGDGVLDTPLQIDVIGFPAYFRIVAAGEFGEAVTFEIVSSPASADFLDSNGTLRVAADGRVKGTTGEIRIRATSGTSSTILTIPAIFR